MLLLAPCLWSALNNRPVIGILSQPSYPPLDEFGKEFVPGSYVSWIESAGGLTTGISQSASDEEVESIFASINGVLFTGGSMDLNNTSYYKTAKKLIDLAVAANNKGDYFPIWGTCNGFELLSVAFSGGDMNVLTSFDAENISLPLQFTDYGMQSEMFQFAGPQIASTFKLPITMNNHVYGVSPESFTEYHLDEIFNVVSLSYDRQNQPFISTMEGNGLPIFSSQWHPEKPELYVLSSAYGWNLFECVVLILFYLQ